jgi:hypothetical protein
VDYQPDAQGTLIAGFGSRQRPAKKLLSTRVTQQAPPEITAIFFGAIL